MNKESLSPAAMRAWELFDESNSKDPNQVETSDGKLVPRELRYSDQLTAWILKLAATPSEALLLASRCQHLCRWEIPRSSHPMDRAGYLKWRTRLKEFHAEKAGEIMKQAGCDHELIRKVQDINLKKEISKNPDTQTMEDALCLVFLEHQFPEFLEKTEDEKVVSILQKTWAKMSDRGRASALKLNLTGKQKQLMEKALGAN
jgi:hypothetical protein